MPHVLDQREVNEGRRTWDGESLPEPTPETSVVRKPQAKRRTRAARRKKLLEGLCFQAYRAPVSLKTPDFQQTFRPPSRRLLVSHI